MLDSVRTWLARLLVPEGPSRKEGAPALPAPAPVGGEGSKRADLREMKRLQRRLREARDRAERAEARLASAETSAREAEDRASAAVRRADESAAKARRIEEELARHVDASGRERDAGASRIGALEEKLAVAEEQARAAERRAVNAERLERAAKEREREFLERGEALPRELAAAKNDAESDSAASVASPRATARGAARSRLDAHFSPGDACLMAICNELEAARDTADLCVFTITDDRIARAVLDAHRRGVRVRIITDDDKANDEGSDVRRLRRAGIEVREDRSPFHMHHKFAVFDGRSMLTGSYNWTRGAAANNQENIVVTDDERLLDAFHREFHSLWAKFGPT